MTRRYGFTLIEIVIVMTIIGIMLAVSIPFVRSSTDRGSVASTRQALAAMHALAKQTAIQRQKQTALVFWPTDTTVYFYAMGDNGSWQLEQPWNTRGMTRIGRQFGASFTTNRTTLFFTPRGIGQEWSGTTMIITKGTFTDTLTISAAGRLIQQ